MDNFAVNYQLRRQPGFIQAIQNSLILAFRSLLKVWHTPEQLTDVTLQPVFFILMFAYIFGGAIAGNVHKYLPTIVPAILVQTLFSASIISGTQLREDMDTGVFDRFKSLPIAQIAPLAGPLLADILRYVVAMLSTFITGYIIGYRPAGGVGHLIIAALFVIGFSWSISWVFAFVGVVARTASSVQAISMLVMFPLMFLSNAFVPVETMPHAVQWFAKNNPISHIITAVRELTNVGKIGSDFVISLIGMIIIVGIFAPLTVRIYSRRT
ncbi:ABC-2 type transporter [Caldicellulosiruptor hydrothermalis 108]|uniref:Transport permease protein n=1 Tax=Caldicellulosiruptor hydrothermalis (strain DSM 18901 / VKM B-2411 / 108) TaxID=632292 RepID=E4QAK8_CALH1|nr:ABC transporter permease [Caldicellulosiruptor hydrothermalis]ADQ05933.1 ABC-2 type transporter [Caldicellulosiruptor hydrothermalis 108]